MKFTNQFPKKEIIIETTKKVGSLTCDSNSKIHYRNYKGYLDTVNHIVLEGDKNAWYSVKSDFLYDTLMNTVKNYYKDSYGRVLNVNILN
tara:strand:+ start:546 stop:815 length:270 start_codon:yes stop_codon:yes gene_type:complete